VHRAGRTARAEAQGRCLSLCASGAEERTLQAWVDESGTHELQWDALSGGNGERAARLQPPYWCAVRIGGGKRAKLSKGDVLGAVVALTGIPGSQVGRIEVFADCALVGLPRASAREAAAALRAGKIKRERRLVQIASADQVSLKADGFRVASARADVSPPDRGWR